MMIEKWMAAKRGVESFSRARYSVHFSFANNWHSFTLLTCLGLQYVRCSVKAQDPDRQSEVRKGDIIGRHE